jgi:hypothetical protein
MKEESSLADSSDNYFTGLGSALFAFYVNAEIEGEAFVKQNEKSKQLILSLQSAWFDRNMRRTEITELIQEELKIIANVVSTELRALVLELLPFNLDFEIPSTDIYNAKAKIHLVINNPTRADSLAEILSNLIIESGTEILQMLQMRTGYEIPLYTEYVRGYNPMNLTQLPNIRIKRNGTTSRYPVKDKRTGSFLWVGGDAEYFSFDRYGGNSAAVSSMEQFLKEIYPNVTVVSEYDGFYQLAGRGAEEFDGFFDYLERYEGIAEGTIEPTQDELYMVDGEFDLDAAISALADLYNYYDDDNALRQHLEVLATLEPDELGHPIMQYKLPLEEVYARVESYDSWTDDEQGLETELIETFNTQSGEVSPMESEQSRPFFNPQVVEPYDLSELPSGSEVSYSSENWRDHMDNWEEYEEELIKEKAKLEKALPILVGSEVHAAVDKRLDEIRNMLNCRCDGYETCNACVSEWRRNRYGRDTHDVDCMCDACSGNSRQYAESFEAESKPRLSEKQLWSLNVMKTSIYHGGEGSYAYVEVDNRGYKPFMSRPVQGLLNKGLIDIPRNKNPGFWGSVESYNAYLVFLTPLAWEYDYTYPFSSGNRDIRQEGNKMVSEAESFDARPANKRVRTMTGKPHQPRKLVKDKNITPEDAAKKRKLEAEEFGAEEDVGVGSKKWAKEPKAWKMRWGFWIDNIWGEEHDTAQEAIALWDDEVGQGLMINVPITPYQRMLDAGLTPQEVIYGNRDEEFGADEITCKKCVKIDPVYQSALDGLAKAWDNIGYQRDEIKCPSCGERVIVNTYDAESFEAEVCPCGCAMKGCVCSSSCKGECLAAESFAAESGQMCEVCFGNDDLPYDSDHFTECGRCGKSVCLECDGEMEYHPDWFKVCGECDTILENVSIHGAESFGAEKELVVDTTEESGITTETRQYKKKNYNPDKMKTDIPADVLNQTDSDDKWIAICVGLLALGVGLGFGQVRARFNL